ncbi:Protein impaired in BABA-induced sterility 1 [Vitis vinifera]|uniref:Protein impaired in BABA-induced sterility 1 n=1 Tax=Vitis vinifera TaxID=29760 RepID=A0A438I1G7_VITVI|nr:Protein impaired in BABA-induced sterility 1 [Vitis vinifera]
MLKIARSQGGENFTAQTQGPHKLNGNGFHIFKEGDGKLGGEPPKPSIDVLTEASHMKNASQGDIPFSGPLQVSTSSGFAWAKRRKDDASTRSHSRSVQEVLVVMHWNLTLHCMQGIIQIGWKILMFQNGGRTDSRGYDSSEIAKRVMLKQWGQFERPDSLMLLICTTHRNYHCQCIEERKWQLREII